MEEFLACERVGMSRSFRYDPRAVTLDLCVDLGLVVVVVRERGVDLWQRPMRMRDEHSSGVMPQMVLSITTSLTLMPVPAIQATLRSSTEIVRIVVVAIVVGPIKYEALSSGALPQCYAGLVTRDDPIHHASCSRTPARRCPARVRRPILRAP